YTVVQFDPPSVVFATKYPEPEGIFEPDAYPTLAVGNERKLKLSDELAVDSFQLAPALCVTSSFVPLDVAQATNPSFAVGQHIFVTPVTVPTAGTGSPEKLCPPFIVFTIVMVEPVCSSIYPVSFDVNTIEGTSEVRLPATFCQLAVWARTGTARSDHRARTEKRGFIFVFAFPIR